LSRTSKKRKGARPNKGGRASARPQAGGGHGQAGAGRRPSRARIRRRLRAGAIVAAAIAFATVLWWVTGASHRDFVALAEGGRDAMAAAVEREPSQGRGHISGAIDYDHRFPTSGPHNPTWVEPGVYETRQPRERLVHALEHGNIVIYYDEPGDEVMARLREWAGIYDNQWSGIVVTPEPGLGESLVLSAWTRRLRLDAFEPAVAAAFIDAYRGRGPENPVR